MMFKLLLSPETLQISNTSFRLNNIDKNCFMNLPHQIDIEICKFKELKQYQQTIQLIGNKYNMQNQRTLSKHYPSSIITLHPISQYNQQLFLAHSRDSFLVEIHTINNLHDVLSIAGTFLYSKIELVCSNQDEKYSMLVSFDNRVYSLRVGSYPFDICFDQIMENKTVITSTLEIEPDKFLHICYDNKEKTSQISIYKNTEDKSIENCMTIPICNQALSRDYLLSGEIRNPYILDDEHQPIFYRKNHEEVYYLSVQNDLHLSSFNIEKNSVMHSYRLPYNTFHDQIQLDNRPTVYKYIPQINPHDQNLGIIYNEYLVGLLDYRTQDIISMNENTHHWQFVQKKNSSKLMPFQIYGFSGAELKILDIRRLNRGNRGITKEVLEHHIDIDKVWDFGSYLLVQDFQSPNSYIYW